MISQSKAKGFTIVELLIVIVIIGILAAISIVAYNGVTQKARDDERVSDARNIVNAAASYNAEYGAWPTAGQVRGADDVTGQSSGTKFTTVKLTGNASSRITGTAPSASAKDNYQYEVCSTGSPAQDTGVRVTVWKEGKDPAGTEVYTAGTCS